MFSRKARKDKSCFEAETQHPKKKSLIISNSARARSILAMASEDEYDSMEELALVEDMSKKLESGMQSDQAQASKPKASKPKAASATPVEVSLEDKIAAREKQIQENEIKMLHLDISIQKIQTNVSKCIYALKKLDPNVAEAVLA